MAIEPLWSVLGSCPVTAPLSCESARPASAPNSMLPCDAWHPEACRVAAPPPLRNGGVVRPPISPLEPAEIPSSSRKRLLWLFLAEMVSRVELRVLPVLFSAVGSRPADIVPVSSPDVMPRALQTVESASRRREPPCTQVPSTTEARADWKPAISDAVITMLPDTVWRVVMKPCWSEHDTSAMAAMPIVVEMMASAFCSRIARSSAALAPATVACLRAPDGRETVTSSLLLLIP
mmetsp:Transcript_6348/g.16262  ORF Transcript_6348/g.16262 Transcript_6348/m.16262 type:complete len:234 (-) Transcript_6348:2142-2843(-)